MLAQCPVHHGFDPFAADYLNDPYPLFRELRAEGAAAYVPRLNVYVVSRYDDVARVLEDRETFLSAEATSPFMPVCDEAKAILASGFPRKPTFTNADPPRHPKMRFAASRCLTAKRWAKAQPAVRAYAEQLIQELARKPVAELMSDLAFPLPAFAGFSLLGFPAEDTELLKGWCGRRVALTYGDLDPASQVEAARQLVDFWSYTREFVERRLTEPGDDLCTDLLEFSRQRPDDLTTEDIINMIYSISLAAHETTTAAILNGLQVLLRDRAQWNAVCNDPALIDGTVEELLRINSPTVALRRRTARDVQLGEAAIPAGSIVFVLLASANRDERHFPNADTLKIDRDNASDQLSFGRAWHLCLGAPLARFEIGVVLELLAKHTPNMRLIEDQQPHYPVNILIRSPEQLFVAPGVAA